MRYDEDDVRVRPGKGSRPRTKTRPEHRDASGAFVVAVDRGRYTCIDADDRVVTAMRARELGRKSVVVGDRVFLVGDTTGDTGTLARIVRIQPRTSTLRRTADDTDPVERIVVANADQLVIVMSLADPEPAPRLIDRCLVAAYDAGIEPLLLLTKADLATPDDLVSVYEPLGVEYVVSARGPERALDEATLDDLEERLRGRVTVLVGHSGVGKSTVVNALVPTAERRTGHVNVVTGRGRHTSTSVVALRLPTGGWVVDTPGIRSFGLAHVHPDTVVAAFPELAEAADNCPQGCSHAEGAVGCALDHAVSEGRVSAERVASLRRLLATREAQSGD